MTASGLPSTPQSRLLIRNGDGILYAVVVERWEYVPHNRAYNWQFFAIDHTSAEDMSTAKYAVLSKYTKEKVRVVAAAPVIGVWGNEKTGIQI